MSLNLTNQEIILIGILIALFVICFTLISIAKSLKHHQTDGVIYHLDDNFNESNIVNKESYEEDIKKEEVITSIEEIKDEDMLIAALVATIDYANEFGNDVVLTSIKQIS